MKITSKDVNGDIQPVAPTGHDNMTQAHTPTPWVLDGFNLAAIIRLKFPKGHPECQHITGTYENIARCEGENALANAAFIVKCVNAHDDLVALLREFLECGENVGHNEDFINRVKSQVQA